MSSCTCGFRSSPCGILIPRALLMALLKRIGPRQTLHFTSLDHPRMRHSCTSPVFTSSGFLLCLLSSKFSYCDKQPVRKKSFAPHLHWIMKGFILKIEKNGFKVALHCVHHTLFQELKVSCNTLGLVMYSNRLGHKFHLTFCIFPFHIMNTPSNLDEPQNLTSSEFASLILRDFTAPKVSSNLCIFVFITKSI